MFSAKLRISALIPFAAALLLTSPVHAQQSKPSAFDPAQEQAIQEIVRDYLLKNPEVLIESLQTYQEREKVAAAERQREALKTRRAALNEDPDAPVLGNPDGDVTVVEFFDYRCPYCKKVADDLREAVAKDGNVRLVMKEFPILGPESQYAARAALAAVPQGLYEEFHFALMTTPGKITQSGILKIAEQVGLDVGRLERDMESEAIEAMLQKNIGLAGELDIRGTPAFVVGSQVYPGALDMRQLRNLIAQARAESS